MPLLRSTPWENTESLLRLRDQFYNQNELNSQLGNLIQACDIVDAWAKRGQVPHVILATASLTRAFSNDKCSLHHSALIAPGYSDALSKFVTGLVDLRQNTAYKRSMFEIAKNIGLPDAYVRLRHDIVHEGYSNITELRRFGLRALNWLYDEYWKYLKFDFDPESKTQHPRLDAESEIREGVSDKFRLDIFSELNNFQSTIDLRVERNIYQTQEEWISYEYKALHIGKRLHNLATTKSELSALVGMLLNEHYMLPHITEETFPSNMCHRWEPLLLVLHELLLDFMSMLVRELILVLVRSSAADNNYTARPYGCVVWLRYLCTSPTWEPARQNGHISMRAVLAICQAHPSTFTTLLTLMLTKYPSHGDNRNEWDPELTSWFHMAHLLSANAANGKKVGKNADVMAHESSRIMFRSSQKAPQHSKVARAFQPRSIGKDC